MGQRHVAVGLQHLVPVAGLQMHRLGGADLEQGGGRHAPGRRRRQQNQRGDLHARRQHLRQQPAHGMAHQDGRRFQRVRFPLPGRRHNRPGRWCPARRAALFVMKAQARRGDGITGGFEFLLQTVQRPGPQKAPWIITTGGFGVPLCQVLEGGNHRFIGLALERHDQAGQRFQADPLAGGEFRLMRRQVDVAILAGEAHGEPFLALAAILAVKRHAHQMLGQIIGHPVVHLGDDFGLVGADFFLQLAQRRLSGCLALVDAALRHLPAFHASDRCACRQRPCRSG